MTVSLRAQVCSKLVTNKELLYTNERETKSKRIVRVKNDERNCVLCVLSVEKTCTRGTHNNLTIK